MNCSRDQPYEASRPLINRRARRLLQGISQDYVRPEYASELVRACRRKYPEEWNLDWRSRYVRIVEGDARDLSRFADGSFQLVVRK